MFVLQVRGFSRVARLRAIWLLEGMKSKIAALAKITVLLDPRILTVCLNSSLNVAVGFVLARWRGVRQTLNEGHWIAALIPHDGDAVTNR